MPNSLKTRTLVIATGHDLSLALLDGEQVLAATDTPMAMGHAESLMPAIEQLLQPFGGRNAAIGRIVVETGPGSFTGLRVGLAAARALAIAWNVPVSGIRSTELSAAAARENGENSALLVMLAAPRGQIWVEGFGESGLDSQLEPAALSLEEAGELARDWPAHAGSALIPLGLAGMSQAPRASAFASLAQQAHRSAKLLYVRAAPANIAA